MDRNQLGQYWQWVVQDRDTFPDCCDRCAIGKEMNYVFVELQDAYLSPKTTPANDEESKPYQPVL